MCRSTHVVVVLITLRVLRQQHRQSNLLRRATLADSPPSLVSLHSSPSTRLSPIVSLSTRRFTFHFHYIRLHTVYSSRSSRVSLSRWFSSWFSQVDSLSLALSSWPSLVGPKATLIHYRALAVRDDRVMCAESGARAGGRSARGRTFPRPGQSNEPRETLCVC